MKPALKERKAVGILREACGKGRGDVFDLAALFFSSSSGDFFLALGRFWVYR